MPRITANDLDYLGARLHGRRSRLAEAGRLESLCRLSGLPELGRAVCPETGFQAAWQFQRRWLQDLVRELAWLVQQLEGREGELPAWLLARFQFENLKVLLRAYLNHLPAETSALYLVSLPRDLALDAQKLRAANSLAQWVELLPAGILRTSLKAALIFYRDPPRLFFLEGALDHGYFREFLARAARVAGEDGELIRAIAHQAAAAFNFMLAVRGRFHYGLAPESLLFLHVPDCGISRGRFGAMLAAPDLEAAARLAVGRAIDALPSGQSSDEGAATNDASVLEALAWNRFLRLSNRAFRRSHTGLAAVVGYVGIRRVEVANLVTLSEGLAAGLAAEPLFARLHPRAHSEPAHV